MKNYNRLMIIILVLFAVGILIFNLTYVFRNETNDQMHNVEINRLMERFLNGESVDSFSLENCQRITDVEYLSVSASHGDTEQFYKGNLYVIRPFYKYNMLDGYIKFSYILAPDTGEYVILQNVVLILLFIGLFLMLMYIRSQIIRPMSIFSHLPSTLAKGDFTTPIRAQKGRFFGKFLWGLDMLRQTLSNERQRTLALEKEKSETALSLSHDIKTPLNTILLCSKALQEGLYEDTDKQNELLQKISVRAHEIEGLLATLQHSISNNMPDMQVDLAQHYLSDVINRVEEAYRWQLELVGTDFIIGEYSNCLLSIDADRTFEAICNLIENAMKYGDGCRIELKFSREEGCQLVTVSNTGNTLPREETVRLFESFWRGSNSAGKQGNGLGLFIARHLAVKMGGEAFATHHGNEIDVTLVLKIE